MKVYCVIITYSYHYNSPEYEDLKIFKIKKDAEDYAKNQKIEKPFYSYTVEEKEVI